MRQPPIDVKVGAGRGGRRHLSMWRTDLYQSGAFRTFYMDAMG